MESLPEKTLCYRYARYVLIAMGLGILCLLGVVLKWEIPRDLLTWLRPHQREQLRYVLRFAGVALLIVGLHIWLLRLRCPTCGRGFAMPWWRRDEMHFCSRCGSRISFADEAEESDGK